MPQISQCVACAWEAENNVRIDDSLSNVAWGRRIGVSEGGIRRHRVNHAGREPEAGNAAGDDADPLAGGKMELGPDGGSFEDVRSDRPLDLGDWDHVFAKFKLDPAQFEILDDTVYCSTWQTSKRTEDGDRDVIDLYSYKARFRRKGANERALSELYREAERRTAPPILLPSRHERSTVVVLADWQIGKTGRRGGTPELLARLEHARRVLAGVLAERAPKRVVLLDGGDGIEGFESGGDPQFTNDLSLPDQLDAYATEMFKFVRLAQAFGPVDIGAVPSNHAAWRRGRQSLGTPADDFGLFVHRQVAKLAEAKDWDARWHFPAEYDESLSIDVDGTPVGLIHGNQFGPGKAIDWWQSQAFGAQAVTHADVLVTAHYHTWGAGVAGINQATGRERHWLGAPTLDNGSDWYKNIAGRDSLPGTLVFDVTPDGFDLGSLTILGA
ncbi:hypothetical protein [Agromyces larvae]|uniref:Calcineurin-like phosphoesterase domain-containing protein n=1 Tax=Agromyces larvae TaxID=2929802 RepID=A0ABY4C4K2_9MICO|nr:hypothetical protein [Agromyces larvae]UOE45899.1 hypothetical protein MTO99_09210 [Agromyces larvae]